MADIRDASMDDLHALTSLVEKYRAFYLQEPSERTETFLTERLMRGESVVFVAESDGQLVGFAQCYPSFSTVSLSIVWLLNDLFVEPEHRGGGIANQLMDHAESAAKQASASRIWLRTAHGNQPARTLYERRGWVYDEVFRRYDLLLDA
ncbi:MAG: GNAT family N-acetyltransferase [Microbacteriaceae bacterium]|nr:GNAT family N-acetyltransferase [Microbacteriaceae bacterium]